MEDWLVCRSLPALVPLLVARASEVGAEAYYPRIAVLKRLSRQRNHGVVHVPAYPGYFFLKSDHYSLLPRQDAERFRLLRQGPEIVKVSEEIIEAIRADEVSWAEELPGPQKSSRGSRALVFRPGDEARITSGLFTKKSGVVVSALDNLCEVQVGGLTIRINHFLLEAKPGRREPA